MSFFILEGPNGGGKTTVYNRLQAKGVDVFESPGSGTELSKTLRPWCRGTAAPDIDPKIQMLLFSAARMDEYNRRVRDVDHPVVASRWWTSTYVYQCMYQNLPLSLLEATLDPSEQIQAMILLTADPAVLVERVRSERARNPSHGHCSWTKDYEKTLQRIYGIYMMELPAYMASRGVPTITIDTGMMGVESVQRIVEKEIGL